MTLHAPHPYLSTAPEIALRVDLLPAVPGIAITPRDIERAKSGAYSAPGRHWVLLAGPYRIEAGRYLEGGVRILVGAAKAEAERRALVALLWDLGGHGPARRLARHAVVRTAAGIHVYRCASECAYAAAA